MSGRAALGLAVLLLGLGPAAAAGVRHDRDPETGLERWQLRAGALAVELVQRLPDQTRAFFMGRGFTADSADQIATACVFQAIVRNQAPAEDTGPALGIDLARWRIEHQGVRQALALEPEWQTRWAAADETRAARIAFRWALFPTEQVFQPGDYNWGMVALGPAPGSTVALELVWQEDGQARQGRIAGVQCPPDRSVDN